MPDKPQEKTKGLTVYAIFEIDGHAYKPGDLFTVPAGWVRDAAHDETRAIGSKHGAGMTYITDTGKRITLPVKE